MAVSLAPQEVHNTNPVTLSDEARAPRPTGLRRLLSCHQCPQLGRSATLLSDRSYLGWVIERKQYSVASTSPRTLRLTVKLLPRRSSSWDIDLHGTRSA
jgi:hypothetical protein